MLTGEHGVGVEKRNLMETMFNDNDLKQQRRVRCAFDPAQILDPGKVFPVLHRRAGPGRVHVHRHRFRAAAVLSCLDRRGLGGQFRPPAQNRRTFGRTTSHCRDRHPPQRRG